MSFTAFVTSDGGVDNDPEHSLDDDHSSGMSTADPEKDAYDEKDSSVVRIKGLDVMTGRPDVHKMLEDAVAKSTGPMSVDGVW